MEITRKQLAELLGLSTRRISQLAKAGIFKNVSRGKYDLKQVVQAYVDYRIEVEQKRNLGNEDISLTDAKKRREIIEAELKLLQLKEKRGELIEREKVVRIATEIVTNTKSRFLAMPSKIAPLLIGIKSIKKIKVILEKEIYNILNDLAKLGDELK